MISTIYFLTSNYAKLTLAQRLLLPFGIDLIQADLSPLEPQADRVEMVVSSKAQQGYAQLRKPMIAEDGGFFINALHGFPGPYTRYVLETLGVGGVMRLMYGLRDRSCRFVSALTYIDEQGTLHTFLDESAAGTLSHSVDATVTEVYSDWWRIFIPAGESKPLSALPESERNRLTRAWAVNSVYGQFGRWYTEQLKPPASF